MYVVTVSDSEQGRTRIVLTMKLIGDTGSWPIFKGLSVCTKKIGEQKVGREKKKRVEEAIIVVISATLLLFSTHSSQWFAHLFKLFFCCSGCSFLFVFFLLPRPDCSNARPEGDRKIEFFPISATW